MKKLLCMILALIMVLSLCACGQKETNSGRDQTWNKQTDGGNGTVATTRPTQETTQPTQTTTLPAVPTEEEEMLLKEYVRTVGELNQAKYYTQYQDVYAKLLEMEAVDKWVGTEYATSAYRSVWYNDEDLAQGFNEETDWDRQAVLARFDVVEDVYLGHSVTAEDNLGNAMGNKEMTQTRQYYTDGKVSYTNYSYGTYMTYDWENFKNSDIYTSRFDAFHILTRAKVVWEYDEAGRVIRLKDEDGGAVKTLFEISYNTDGTISKLTKKTNTEQTEYTYTYQENGRIVTVTDNQYIAFEYVYNADGTLAKETVKTYYYGETLDNMYFLEYTYNADGYLASATGTYQGYSKLNDLYKSSEAVHQYTFTTDAQGRVTQVEEIPGDVLHWNHKGEQTSTRAAEEAKITYTLYYGDFYIYTPAE